MFNSSVHQKQTALYANISPVHTGDNVERTFNIRATKSTKLATMSTVEFKSLLICCQNRQQSRPYTATADVVADLSSVSAIVDFQQSRSCWVQLLSPVCTGLHVTFCEWYINWHNSLHRLRKLQGGHKFGWKKFKNFSRTSKYVFKTYFSAVLQRCGDIKSKCINFIITNRS